MAVKTNVYDITLERDELTRNIGGGIPKESIVLIEGADGTGKSIIVQRFCYGLLKNNVSVTYVGTELSTMEFVKQMNSLNYPIDDQLLKDKMLYIPMFPYYGNVKLHPNFIDRLFSAKKLYEKDVIIFDCLSFLIVKDGESKTTVFEIISFFKRLINMGKTIIFTVDSGHLNDDLLTLIRNISEVYITTELHEFAGELIRIMSIKRFKRSAESTATKIPFKVEPGEGFVVEIAGMD
ncbi:MAG: ATPase domain-containing protein [Candidatus Woesearchaeota archaeon]|jgi:flagellar protein FlaH